MDITWSSLCDSLTGKKGFELTRSQFEHLVYIYKTAIADKRMPYKHIESSYLPLLKEFRYCYPTLFKETDDGDIHFIDSEYELENE